MILGPKKLLELVKKIKLVEGLSSRELKNPEGAGFDLRLGELYKIKGKAFLGETERQTPKITLYKSYKTGKSTKVAIKPGQYFLATTIEKVNTPKNLTINFKPRTTTFRSGLILRTGNVAPGYVGKLTFAIKNEGPCNVILEMGCRIVHAQFSEVKGGGTIYRGQWQGGRVTTRRKEKQI
jgi:deoxycytidine triphosphate deaminase